MKKLCQILFSLLACSICYGYSSEPYSETPSSTEMPLSMQENLYNGEIIKLSDGSTWEIAPQDRNISSAWLFSFPVEIEKSNNSSYPYYLVNKRTGSKVLARRS